MTTTNGNAGISAKTLARIRAVRLIDGDFMQACFHATIPCAEPVLRIIMKFS